VATARRRGANHVPDPVALASRPIPRACTVSSPSPDSVQPTPPIGGFPHANPAPRRPFRRFAHNPRNPLACPGYRAPAARNCARTQAISVRLRLTRPGPWPDLPLLPSKPTYPQKTHLGFPIRPAPGPFSRRITMLTSACDRDLFFAQSRQLPAHLAILESNPQ
jgi:hypothetical protein